MRNNVTLWITLMILLLLSTGCPHGTPAQRTAFIPGPTIPAQAGAPLNKGDVKLRGELSSFEISPDDPLDYQELLNTFEETDISAVYIPRWMVGAAASFAPRRYLELGAHIRYTNIASARPNSDEVPPMPPHHYSRDLLLFGLGIRGNAPLPNIPLTLSFMGEFSYVAIPQAIFLCENCESEDEFEGPPSYRYARTSRHRVLLPKLHLQVSLTANEYAKPFVVLGTQRSARNQGLGRSDRNGDRDYMKGDWILDVGAGVEFRKNHVFSTILVFLPLETREDLPFGPFLGAQAGVIF